MSGLFILLYNISSCNIGRHQIRRELNPVALQPHDCRQRLDQTGLAQTRQTDQQRMPTAQKRRKRQIHNGFLPDKPSGNRASRGCQLGLQGLNLGNQIGIRHGETPHPVYIR